MPKLRIAVKIFIAPALLFLFHLILSIKFHIYYTWPWFDVPMHFLGGASIALAAGIFFSHLYSRGVMKNMPRLMEIFLLISIAGLAGIIWEFAEFAGDYFLTNLSLQPSLADTMGDLASDLLGAFTVGIIYFFQYGKSRFTKDER